jgi:hypothetical protein
MQTALKIVEQVIDDVLKQPEGKNQHAQALSALGASKGGKARAAKLTKERLQEIARKAANSRWKKKSL